MITDREMIQRARQRITQNVLASERPGADELMLLSDAYQRVWTDHDRRNLPEGTPESWSAELR